LTGIAGLAVIVKLTGSFLKRASSPRPVALSATDTLSVWHRILGQLSACRIEVLLKLV
jgi:hypothetical protein